MRTEINLQKLIALKELYLRQKYSEKTDIDILSKWERGESVIVLSREYHRSPSSIYRLRERVAAFLRDPPDTEDIYSRLLSDLWVDIPMPLLPCALDCTDDASYILFRMSIGLYLTGSDLFFPRWFLSRISSSLGRKRYAMSTMENMKELSIDTGLLFRFKIYERLEYDKGILFKFSKITEGILDAYPSSLLLKTIEETSDNTKEI